MHRVKTMVLIILCVAFVLSGTQEAFAAEHHFPSGFLIADQNGIHVTAQGDYLIHATDLSPGDNVRKKLTIRNLEADTFDLSMTAQPLEETGKVALLDAVNLRLVLDGKEIYSGRMRGDDQMNMIKNALDLGKYKPGESRVMDITLTVDEDMPLYYSKSTADIQWKFYAIRDEKIKPPKTSEFFSTTTYILAASAMILLSVLLLYKKRKKTFVEH